MVAPLRVSVRDAQRGARRGRREGSTKVGKGQIRARRSWSGSGFNNLNPVRGLAKRHEHSLVSGAPNDYEQRSLATFDVAPCVVDRPCHDLRMEPSQPSPRAGLWDRLLLLVVGGVTVYALGLVLFGLVLGDQVFGRLGFGLDDGEIVGETQREYIQLVYGILGAVIVGWMLTIGAIVVGPLRRRESWAWWAVVTASAVWFVLDTGLSLILGFVGHALFNVGFAIALAVPLGAIRNGPK